MKRTFIFLFFIQAVPGFAQNYNNPGGTINTCSGTFYDTGGNGGDYANSESITTTFCPSVAGQCVTLAFTAFDLESSFDYLYIYDGPNTSSPQIGGSPFSGLTSPGTISATNANGCLTFRFTSDGSVTHAGWRATISCGACPPPGYNNPGGTVNACSGSFYDTGGPSGTYGFSESITTTFCPTIAGQCVTVNFSSLDLENNYDYLYVYNGSSTGSPQVMGSPFTGTTSPGSISSTAAGGCLTFRFTSDGSVSYNGWVATISCAACGAPPPCSGTTPGCASPPPDNCSGACNLGTLSSPPACPSTTTVNNTFCLNNTGATAANPYTALAGCQPSGDMPMPAADVWYRFTATSNMLDINITSTSLNTPSIGIYEGTTCGNMIGRACFNGSGGNLTATFQPVTPGGTYFVQISGGNTAEQGDFTLSVTSYNDCNNCLIASNLTSSPSPISGTYISGQTINFCYNVTQWTATAVNWLHGVTLTFGAGWNTSTIVATPPASCDLQGTWGWYNSVMGSTTGLTWGPGFFYDSPSGNLGGPYPDGNPGDNYGDNCNGAVNWNFCWSIQTGTCPPLSDGASLNIVINTTGDQESGSWTSTGCQTDPVYTFFATLNCCSAPVMTVVQNVSCFGGSNGSATATGQGTSPYTYVWNDPAPQQSTSTATGLTAGTWTVTVTDAGGCVSTGTVTITEPAQLTATQTQTNAPCNGSCNGTASVTPSGGTTPYSYTWSGGGTATNKTGLCAGSYTVTITDNKGCTITKSFTITQPAAITVTMSNTSLSCFGVCNGTATASPSGGTSPYSYAWSGGGTASNKTGLCAGSYTVTVTDANSCTATNSTTVTQPTALSATTTVTNTTCNGNCNGAATVSASGGTTPYSYSWSGGGTATNKTALCAGSFTVTVTDNKGCTVTANATVTSPPAITISFSVTNINCNGQCTGSIAATPSGGTSPYTYVWTTCASMCSNTITGLCAGSYSVTVTDANSCTVTSSSTVTQPAALSASATSVNITCNGLCNGSASVTASGGTTPYTYAWSGGGTATNKTGLCTGSYTVTVTDNNGCTTTASATVTQPAALSITPTVTNITCNGLCNGSASAAVTGGITPYSYNWSNGVMTSNTISSLCAGSFTVTVTDANGCTLTNNSTVTQPAALTAATGVTNILCNGQCTGSANVTPSGGTSPYTYIWSGGGTATNKTGLCAGSYTVTVTDNKGCTVAATATVTQPVALSATTSVINILCNGQCTGSSGVTASGGVTPYTYSWSGGGTASNKTGLCAGSYTVTLSDANGCTATATATVTQPSALSATVSVINVLCNGLCTGSASVIASGGTTPYSYSWSGGGTASNKTGLCAGSYTVTVTDAGGCTTTAAGTITQPAVLNASTSVTNLLCNGVCNGSVTASGTGGVTPYTFNWSNGTMNSATITNVCSGSYTVTATDANGCTAANTATVTQPVVLSLTAGSTNILCNGQCNGSATATVSGGITPYTYAWSGGGTASNKTGLCAGSYTVTATDANGCTKTATVTITQPAALTTSTTVVNVTCNGLCNGSSSVTASGGITPYTYAWNGGGTASNKIGLCAGSYTVTVTDANGCTTTATTSVTQPAALSASTSVTNVTCNGQCMGSATVTASGGVTPYTYSWSGGGTASNKTGLCAGSYTVTVTDANGCSITSNATITEPPLLTVSVSVTNIPCNGQCTGTVTATPTGGVSPYTYTWTGCASMCSNTINGLCAGNYTVTVTDANGCTATNTTAVTQPATLTATTSATNVTCNGICNGSATVTAGGGITPYTYAWSGGGTATNKTALCAGSYTVTVTDANGCTVASTATVTQPAALTANTTATNITCNGICNGSATVTAGGGVTPYSYAWSGGGTATNKTGLCPGSYTVTVTDANGCTATSTANITQPSSLSATTGVTNILCNGLCNGVSTVTPSGGTAPYTYLWSGGGTATNKTGLCAGSYTVTVTDNKGCTVTATAAITQPAAITLSTAQTNISCNGGNNGSATASASGGTGAYTYIWNDPAPQQSTATATGLTAGSWTVTVTDGNGCTATTSVTITAPAALNNTMSGTNVTCNGLCNGSATATIGGGTTPYTYLWNDPGFQTTSGATGLCAGTFSITVTDNKGCTLTGSRIITQPAAITTTPGTTNATCGNSDGSANVTVSGGVTPYTYSWSTGCTASNCTNLSAGGYTVTVTDANGCTRTATATVNDTGSPTATISGSTDATCNGLCNGNTQVTASGGTPPYTYTWSTTPNQTTTNATGLCAGTYTVTVKDNVNCNATGSATIAQPATMIAGITSTVNVSCNGGNNGSATAGVSGGTSPYTYNWTGGQTTSIATGLTMGSYTVTVTDNKGCTATATATITQPAALSSSISGVNVSCNGGSDGSVNLTPGGGVTPYTYSWTGGYNTEDLTNVTQGTYNVTITDANGCTATNTTTITQPVLLTAAATATSASCNGNTDGTASVTAGGGTSPYTYTWSVGGQTTTTATGLSDGSYTVTVTDNKGCTAMANATVTEPAVLTATVTATATSCNGGANGTASVTAGGGTSPYTYAWSGGGQTGTTATGLGANTYTVTVTDNKGCTTTATATVTQPTSITLTTTATYVSCNGGANGTASVTAGGGTNPYTYAWSVGGQTTTTATGLSANTYTVTVTDNKGCTQTATATVTQPAVLTSAISGTNISCNGGSDGTVNLTVSGGTSPYTYSWTGGNTTEDLTNITQGTKNVTITDAGGCITTNTITLTQPIAVTATATTTNANCGQSDGSATVTAGGGTGPYTYSWTGGQTVTTATGLSAGSYTVTVTDNKGCTQTATATVNNQSGGTAIATTTSNVTCNGLCNGSANVTMAGGTTPYTYIWSNGSTTSSATGLCANTYSVTVTDAVACIATASTTVTAPLALTASISVIYVLCNGGNTGAINLTTGGGTTPYSYLWSNSATTEDLNSLAAGTYNVTVTDNKGCTITQTAIISQPAIITATISGTNVSCNSGSNGNADLTVSGGITPYSFSWSNSATTEDITGLASGTYTVTVTDANGCTKTTSATLTQPAVLTAGVSVTNANCGQNDGSATVTAGGGISPYTYSWTGGQTTTTATGFSAGNYSVTVTDNKGCTQSASVAINNQSGGVAAATTTANVTCNGLCNGAVNVSIVGGTAPFTYLWNTGNTGSAVSNLCLGAYSVTVTDILGCTSFASTAVTQPAILNVTVSAIANIACNGQCTGQVSVTPGGGAGSYAYSWNTAPVQTSSSATGLCAGSYTVTLSDANGCTATASANISQPVILTASAAVTNVTCNGGGTGSADLTVSGGITPYTFNWSNSATTEDISPVTAGAYTVTITDANGCTKTATATVTQPAALALSTAVTDAHCGQSDGSATVTATGGVSPYTYNWSPSGQTTSSATGLNGNTYSITVTDNNGCIATATATVNNLPGGTATATVTANASGFGLCNGSASVTMSGGTSPFTYIWTNGSATSTATSLCAGGYCVTVTDISGCSSISCITITQPPSLILTVVGTSILCKGNCTGAADLTVSGGTTPYTYLWSNSLNAQDLTNLCAGNYTVTVTDASGNTATITVSITEPAATLAAAASGTNITCNGLCNGTASITASGGTSPYTYGWSGGGTASSKTGLCAGSNTVTVTDANGCTATATQVITQPSALTATTGKTDAHCGLADGSASVFASGGTTSYTYLWSNSATGSTIAGITAGTYQVTVTDANGCTATASVTVNNLAGGTASAAVVSNASCNGSCNGSASSAISGGAAPFTYLWSNGQNSASANGLCAGSYTVTVTDQNGCNSNAGVTITEPLVLTVSGTNGTTQCYGSCNGSASVSASGGGAPYAFAWSAGGQTGTAATGLCAGSYSVTATDNNGCTAIGNVTVTQPLLISVAITVSNASCGQSDGAASATGSNGVGAYAYIWNTTPAQTASNATGLLAGSYSVTVSDANGCSTSGIAAVGNNNGPTASVISKTDVLCFGGSNGQAVVQVSDGVPPYSYAWSPSGQSAAAATGLAAGAYTVLVTDSNGCMTSLNVTITQPAVVTVSLLSQSDVSCYGACNGSATVSAGGGTGAYIYLWSNSQTAVSAGGLCAGTYYVTVTDANGCSASTPVTVTQPPLLSNAVAVTNTSCPGLCNGSASASASGGTPPYSYQWNDSGSQTGNFATGLCAATYAVSVTDNNGCVVITPGTIGQPGQVSVTVVLKQDVGCYGNCNGLIQVAASSGTPPYTYLWNNLQTTPAANSLCAGNYSVTVTDNKSCTAVVSDFIAQPPAGTVAISKTDVICYGNTDGTAAATAGGGTSPYSYQWNDVNLQTNSSATGLSPGNYSVTVTDNNGCSVTGTVAINQPLQITLSLDTNGSHCGQADGEAIVTISSGSNPPFSYLWSANAGYQTTATATGLAAGTYDVTVTDGAGCTASGLANVSDLGSPALSIPSQGNPDCYGGCNGFATVMVNGGTPPYTYIWSNGQTNALSTGLCAGTYTVSIVDPNGCTANISAIIGQPVLLNIIIQNVTPASCMGSCDGDAASVSSGGTPPYTYQWNDIGLQTASTATGLCSGTYAIVVEDSKGCTATTPALINEPVAMTVSVTTVSSHCGLSDGMATATATGGNGTYQFTWSNSQSDSTALNLAAGPYSVTVTDIKGCSATASASVNDLGSGTAAIANLTDATCNGAGDGSATVSMAGGTPPFTYAWSNGATDQTASGLSAGNYLVSVTDSFACVVTAATSISQPLPVTVLTTGSFERCFGSCDGAAAATPGGGTAPYSYLWDDPLSQTLSAINNLCAGTYNVSVTDGNGCTGTDSAVVSSPAPLSVSETHTDASCGQNNGNAGVIVTGGTPSYSYSWPGGHNKDTIDNVGAGTYIVTVTDSKGCTATKPVAVSNIGGPAAVISNSSDVACNGDNNGYATVTVTGSASPFTFQWNDSLLQATPTAGNLGAGTYIVTITDTNGCMASATITLTEPSPLLFNAAGTNPLCYGDCNGNASVTVTGGVLPYSYQWNDPGNQTALTATGLCAGTYSVIVGDANGCNKIASVTLTAPLLMTAFTNATPNTCFNGCDGIASATAVNGTPPYAYSWDDINNQQTQAASSLCAGTYNVTVTDKNGCAYTASSTVTQPAQIIVSISSASNNSCYGQCSGFAQAAAAGGSAPFTYLWSTGDNLSQAVNLCAGTYTVTVTDANGCTGTKNISITQPLPPTVITSTTVNVTCYNACNGSASVSVSGGVLPYSYLWDDPAFQTTASPGNLCAGIYTLTLTDANGCTATKTIAITEPQILDFTSQVTASTCGNQNGEACIYIVGGVSPYVTTWNDPMTQVGTCAYNLYAGAYMATLSDANGCAISKPVLVNDIVGPVIDSLQGTDVTCGGDSNGTAAVYATGVALPLTYIWKKNGVPLGNNTALFNLPGGTFTITVLDTNGCSASSMIVINEPNTLASAIISKTDVSCNGYCNGSAFAMAGGGITPYTFTWDNSQTGQTAAGLCAGPHSLIVTDNHGCQSYNSLTITEPAVIQLAPVVTGITCSGDCNGMISLLPGPTGGTPFYVYMWTPNAGNGPTITNLCGGSYTVTVLDIKGCTATSASTIIDPPPLGFSSVNVSPAKCGLPNGVAIINASGGAPPYSFQWPGGETTSSVNTLAAGTYFTTITDSAGCSFVQKIDISIQDGPVINTAQTDVLCSGQNTGTATVAVSGGTPPYSYQWNDPAAQVTQTAVSLGAGTYSVVVTDYNGCQASLPVIISEPPPLVLIVTGDTLICYGKTAQISATATGGSGQYAYVWSNGLGSQQNQVVSPVATTVYYVSVTDGAGCSQNNGSIQVNVYPPLSVSVVSSGDVCSGESATLTATASGGNGGPYDYSWLNMLNQNQVITVNPVSDSVFTVIAGDGCSLDDTAYVTVKIYPFPVPAFSLNDSSGCAPLTIQFYDSSTIASGNITGWNWDAGNGQTSSQKNPVFTFNTPGVYSVLLTVTSGNGCDTSITITNLVNVFPVPDAYFVPVPDETTLLLATIQFYDSSSYFTSQWSWDFGEPVSGNLNSDTNQNPIHTYLDTGIYFVQLTVETPYGCMDIYRDTVIIKPDYALFAPNAFTPDGDGNNDFFFPKGIGINPDYFEFYIFDRWGDQIFHTGIFGQSWDGKANNGTAIAQQDVYVWYIKTKDYNGVGHEYVGHVTLLK